MADENNGNNNQSWAAEHKAVIYAALITAVGGIIAVVVAAFLNEPNPGPDPKIDDDYFVNYSFYNVLLEGFAPIQKAKIDLDENSIVTVERIDSIVKNSDSEEDYFLPFYTTGKRMEVDTLKSSVTVTFKETENPDERFRHSYELRLPIGDKNVGHKEVMNNRFTFVNGFRDNSEEWWISSIKYPTKAIGVHIQCPSFKPCKSVKVYRRKGISDKKEIVDNPPFLSEDGTHILWMGNDEKPETRILFRWQW